MQLDVFARPGADRMVALRSMLPHGLVSEQSPKAWIQIARSGTFTHPSAGEFRLDRRVFEALVANFNAQHNPIPLTYEHPQNAGDGQPIPAAGWIHDLDVWGDELWAHVEFTSRAAQMVRDGEYKFCSMVVGFESVNRQTGDEIGPELYEVGLTNVPFLDGMKPIRLSRAGHGASNRRDSIAMSDIELLKKALKELPDDASIDQVLKLVEAEKAKMEAIEGKGSESPQEDAPEDPAAEMSADKPEETVELAAEVPDEVELAEEPMPGSPEDIELAMENSAGAVVGQIAEALGMDEAGAIAFLQEHVEDIAALAAGAPDSGTVADEPTVAGMSREVQEAHQARVAALSKQVSDRDATVKQLSDRLAKLEDDALRREVGDAVEAGLILDADKERFVKLGRSNIELMREFLSTAEKDPAVPGTPYKASAPSQRPNAPAEDYDREAPEYKALAVQLRSVIKDKDRLHLAVCKELADRAARRSLSN